MDFLFVLIELVRYVLRLRPYERKSIENRRFRRNGVSLAKFSDTRSRPPPTILRVAKLDE